jgi:ABC-2 type transport system ATP-binding protein
MLRINNLVKRYGKFTALDGLNLSIEKGELFGFVGPNGAGKTTTMKIISGLLKADVGEVFVDDVDARNDNRNLKKKIGFMPDFFGVYDNLKTYEYMEFYASMYGLIGNDAKKLCNELLDLVNLSDKVDNYVDGLSRGMKQRLCLARSLVHQPELLVLDEPASGLDPRARFEMKGILKNLNEMGKTIIISSHILPELAQMCTSIGIIEKGQMVVQGTVDDIMCTLNSSNPLVIRFLDGKEKGVRILKENLMVENISIKHQNVSVGFRGGNEEEAILLKTLITNDVKICSFTREEGNLESLFMQITEKVEKVEGE